MKSIFFVSFNVAILAILLSSCASRGPATKSDYPVYFTSEGVAFARGYGRSKENALEDALKTTRNYCRVDNTITKILKEEIIYEGIVSEATNESLKVARDITNTLGKNAGSEIINDVSNRNHYTAIIEFECVGP